MTTAFIVLSAILTLVSSIPYIVDVIKGKTKPRIVSWFNWSLLTGIATAAAYADGQIPSAVLTLAATIETALIVILGLKHGDRKFERFDVVCQIGAVSGLILWVIFSSPVIAIIATVTIDFVALLPTLRHSWLKPDEETISTFVLSGIGALFAALAVTNPTISGLTYPIYIVLANFALVALLMLRRHSA
ncbi:MAG: hypothetical protein ABIR37_02280 [Candidatus Saccharimonadales bacterium]